MSGDTAIQIQANVLQQPQQHTNNNNNGRVVSLNSDHHPESLAPIISKNNKKLIHFSPPTPAEQQSNIQFQLQRSSKIDSSPTLSQKSIGKKHALK